MLTAMNLSLALTDAHVEAMTTLYVVSGVGGWFLVDFNNVIQDGPFATKREACKLGRRISPNGKVVA